jgi:hypothetical protein
MTVVGYDFANDGLLVEYNSLYKAWRLGFVDHLSLSIAKVGVDNSVVIALVKIHCLRPRWGDKLKNS